MRPGDLIEFKRGGLVSAVLGGLLKLFERDWDGWGWHVAIAWERTYNGWYILEAIGPGVKTNYYSDATLKARTRSYHWLDKEPTVEAMGQFLQTHIDRAYDVAVYFWTGLAIIIRHYFNRPIPKLLDQRFCCWELAAEFFADMGKPIVSKYDVIIITDILRAIKARPTRIAYGERG